MAAAVLAGSAAHASATGPASLIVIVDGSGSMAGPLEGGGRQNKIGLVRDALRTSLARIGPHTSVGLATFGHGRGCNAVEMVRAPEPVDTEAMVARLDQVRPRGKGPLTLALREAAKLLPRDSAPRSLLLIHDDADNCQPDLCTAAAELSSAGVTAHVVSIGTEAEGLAKMACLPKATGGRHFKAQNAEQLEAFIGEALRLASNPLAVAGFATTIVPPAPIPASGPAALYLRALLAPNTEPLSAPLHWVVFAEGQPQAAVFQAWTANPVVPVTPGRYLVEVGNGLVSARHSVLVREDRPVAVPVVLGAGSVRVRAVALKTGAPLPDAIVTVSRDTGGDSQPVAVFRAEETPPLLPAGRFLVRAELGLVRTEPQVLNIAPGVTATVDIPLNAGRLRLATAGRDGVTPLKSPIFIVTEDDPPRGRREVARSAAAQAEFVLPPGTYYVVARQGRVEAHERLEVGSGDVVRRTLTAPAGRLSLSASGTAPLKEELISYTIRRLDDPSQDAIQTSRPAPVLFLPSGRYRIEGRYGLTNVRTVREIDIKGGQTLQLSLEHQIAALRLRLAGAAGAEVLWEVRDAAGRTVWTSDQTETAATLQAGPYHVVARMLEKRVERAVELRAGETTLVEVGWD